MIKQKWDDFINHNLIKGRLVIFMFESNSLLHLVQQKGVFAAQGSFAFVQSAFNFQQCILHAVSKAGAQIKTWHRYFLHISNPTWNWSKEIFCTFKSKDLPNIDKFSQKGKAFAWVIFLSLQMLLQIHINILRSAALKGAEERAQAAALTSVLGRFFTK